MKQPQFVLNLLGTPQITLDDEPLSGFISKKAQALLFYLAVTNQPHTRDFLAALLWPDMPDADAKTNLRQVLMNLRRLLDNRIETTRQTVTLNPPFNLDVARFKNSLAAAEPDIETLEAALALYREDFLAGFFVDDALPFEEWQAAAREHLRQEALRALHRLVDLHSAARRYPAALAANRRLLELAPWDEQAHRQQMLLLARAGQRAAALAHYQTCVRLLDEELGAPPAPETTALLERIRAIPDNPLRLPAQPTPFLGRSAELARLTAQLADPACRLLTLTGPGGVGKTRLALELARLSGPDFFDGALFLSLAGHTADALAPTIARALNLPLQEVGLPLDQLTGYLQNREFLLALDNFEHLLEAAPQLETLLERAPGLKLLVTSRRRLNTPWEHLFTVEGLPVPGETVSTPEAYDAVRLFLAAAKRVAPAFNPAPADWPAITRMCRMLDGLPLGLELAAAWVSSLSCPEIAAEVERNLDFLTAAGHLPERHHSLRAVFDTSWARLPAAEQAAVRRLSVFRAGFSRSAAESAAGANAAILAALIGTSLLRRAPDGRYHMHELWLQFSADKLAEQPAEYTAARSAHAAWFTAFARERLEALSQPHPETLAETGAELENLQAALEWAIEQKNPGQIETLARALNRFYRGQNRYQEVVELLERIIALEGVSTGEPARWEQLLGEAYYRIGRLPQSREHLHWALALRGYPMPRSRIGVLAGTAGQFIRQALIRAGALRQETDPARQSALVDAARAYEELGQIYFFAGESLPAIYTAVRGLNLAETAPPSPELARLYANMNIAAAFIPWRRLARVYNRLALRAAHALNDPRTLGWALELSAIYHAGIAAWEIATLHANEALEIARQLNDPRRAEESLLVLAHVAQYRGDYRQGLALWGQVYASASPRGDLQSLVWCLNGQAENLIKLGHFEQAIELVNEALSLPVKNSDIVTDITCFGALAAAYLRLDDYDNALKYAAKTYPLAVETSPTSFSSFEGFAAVPEVFLGLWQAKEQAGFAGPTRRQIKEQARQSCQALVKFARIFPLARPRAYLWQGVYAHLQGKPGRAQKHWQAALSAAELLGMPGEVQFARATLTRLTGKNLNTSTGRIKNP